MHSPHLSFPSHTQQTDVAWHARVYHFPWLHIIKVYISLGRPAVNGRLLFFFSCNNNNQANGQAIGSRYAAIREKKGSTPCLISRVGILLEHIVHSVCCCCWYIYTHTHFFYRESDRLYIYIYLRVPLGLTPYRGKTLMTWIVAREQKGNCSRRAVILKYAFIYFRIEIGVCLSLRRGVAVKFSIGWPLINSNSRPCVRKSTGFVWLGIIEGFLSHKATCDHVFLLSLNFYTSGPLMS